LARCGRIRSLKRATSPQTSRFFEGSRHTFQVRRPASEFPHCFGVLHRRDCDIVAFIASYRFPRRSHALHPTPGYPSTTAAANLSAAFGLPLSIGRIRIPSPYPSPYLLVWDRALGSGGDQFTTSPAGSGVPHNRATRHQIMKRSNRSPAIHRAPKGSRTRVDHSLPHPVCLKYPPTPVARVSGTMNPAKAR
jgi:hypothetical protein